MQEEIARILSAHSGNLQDIDVAGMVRALSDLPHTERPDWMQSPWFLGGLLGFVVSIIALAIKPWW